MDRLLFERFLDNLEIYFDVRKTYKKKAKELYKDHPDDWEGVELTLEPEKDVVDNQIDILQNIFEHMVGDNDGNV